MDISTTEMAQEIARLGGIGHISDAMHGDLVDRHYGTDFNKRRFARYKDQVDPKNKSYAQFYPDEVREATTIHVSKAMEGKKGSGAIFVNVMEKVGMNNPLGTLSARLNAALDAGIDGISLAAGLHSSSMGLISKNRRFKDAMIGIIVSSVRALKIFLKKSARYNRLPDFIVVEGPLAGGHLGFKVNDWRKFNLLTIFQEVLEFLKKETLKIPVIPAGGIFTGGEAASFLKLGAAAIQVATRFTVTKESGLPPKTQQRYFKANEEDIEVNMMSPTGYPMRMLSDSPCLKSGGKPNCDHLGYLLDGEGHCKYIDAYYREVEKNPGKRIIVPDKTCLCTFMKAYGTWTCGHYTYRLKETSHKLGDGNYQQLTTEEVFNDYRFSSGDQIALPTKG